MEKREERKLCSLSKILVLIKINISNNYEPGRHSRPLFKGFGGVGDLLSVLGHITCTCR